MTRYTVGDTARVEYELRAPSGALADGTVTLAVTSPGGASSAPVVTRASIGRYHADLPLSEPGVWRWVYTATGAVADTTGGALAAHPTGVEPPWRPSVWDVAARTPNRTLTQIGTGDLTGTFTDTTVPTTAQVERLIDDVVALLAARVGLVHETLLDAARACATTRAAAWVQLAYPIAETTYDYQGGPSGPGGDIAARWQAEADECLTHLIALNAAATGDRPPGVSGAGGPQWVMPTPVRWGDDIL